MGICLAPLDFRGRYYNSTTWALYHLAVASASALLLVFRIYSVLQSPSSPDTLATRYNVLFDVFFILE